MKTKKTTLGQIKSHLKTAATLAVGLGVGEIVGNAVKDSKPEAKGLTKLFIKLGAVALTAMIVDKVNKYVEGEIDDIFEEGGKLYERMKSLAESGQDATDEDDFPDLEEMAFLNAETAESVMGEFRDTLEECGRLSCAFVKDTMGTPYEDRDLEYGWDDLTGMVIEQCKSHYIIKMPRMKRLE